MLFGLRETTTLVAAPAVCVNGAEPLTPSAAAVIVSWSAVDDEWMVIEHDPSDPVVHAFEDNVTSPLLAKFPATFGSPLPPLSVTVAVAVDVDVPPSALIDPGVRVREMALG